MGSHFTKEYIYNEKVCEDSLSFLDLCLCDSSSFELYSWVKFFISDLTLAEHTSSVSVSSVLSLRDMAKQVD